MDVLEKEARRRVEMVKDQPRIFLVNAPEMGALRSLNDDAFAGLYPTLKQYGVTEGELKEYLKYACQEMRVKYAGAFNNPYKTMRDYLGY